MLRFSVHHPAHPRAHRGHLLRLLRLQRQNRTPTMRIVYHLYIPLRDHQLRSRLRRIYRADLNRQSLAVQIHSQQALLRHRHCANLHTMVQLWVPSKVFHELRSHMYRSLHLHFSRTKPGARVPHLSRVTLRLSTFLSSRPAMSTSRQTW